MKQISFAPGFRLGLVDVLVLVGGTTTAVVLSMCVWWWGFVPAYVLAHFFLFCNLVRMARSLELIWAGSFVLLAGASIAIETPSWLVTTLVSLLVTMVLVVVEMRKQSYHGVGWQRINPNLQAWWESQIS